MTSFKNDEDVIAQYTRLKPWGLCTGIDLINCSPEKIRDGNYIKKFIVELCDFIDMRRYGEPVLEDFGNDPG